MDDQTPKLSLPFIMPSQAQKHVTHNEGIRRLDILTQMTAENHTFSEPPTDSPNGAVYLIPENATGAWAGRTNQIAAFQDGAFVYIAPLEGWRVYVKGQGFFVFSDNMWVALEGASGGNTGGNSEELPKLGINTVANDTNRLSVRSDAVLLTTDSGDIRAVVNKEAASDTASLLFQTNFEGRAEVGLTGSDNLHFKVSKDGAIFHDSIILDGATGKADFPMGVSYSGVSSDTRAALHAQMPALTGPTSIKFGASTNRLSWEGRFVTTSTGNGAHFGLDGRFDLVQPSQGTLVEGYGGAGDDTITEDGILLDAWEALYYVLPVGATSASISQNFRRVSSQQAFRFPPSENWVFIALHNGDTGEIRLGNGEIIYPTTKPVSRLQNARVFPVFHVFDIDAFNGDATLVFKQKEIDIGDNYDTETGLFTAPISGVYEFSCFLLTNNQDLKGRFYIQQFLHNGVALKSGRTGFLQLPSDNQHASLQGAVIVSLTANDTIECHLTGGSMWTGVDLNYFSGKLLQPTT